MWTTLREGDWVKAKTDISPGLLGASIKAGTKGAVTSVSYGWLTPHADVDFDSGFGVVRARVTTHQVRLVRRQGGIERFTARAQRHAAARLGLLVFLAWPIISWVAQYLWINKSFSGITGAFATSVVASVGDWITMLATDPVKGLIYLGFLSLVSKLAWR